MSELPHEVIPPEVTAAAIRLLMKPKPDFGKNLPRVFQEIMKNHEATLVICTKGSSMSQEDWRTLRELRRDMKDNLRPAAVNFIQKQRGNRPG